MSTHSAMVPPAPTAVVRPTDRAGQKGGRGQPHRSSAPRRRSKRSHGIEVCSPWAKATRLDRGMPVLSAMAVISPAAWIFLKARRTRSTVCSGRGFALMAGFIAGTCRAVNTEKLVDRILLMA